MSIEIEQPTIYPNRYQLYPLDTVRIGECFTVRYIDDADYKSRSVTIGYWAKKHNKKFTIVRDKQQDTMTVYRIK